MKAMQMMRNVVAAGALVVIGALLSPVYGTGAAENERINDPCLDIVDGGGQLKETVFTSTDPVLGTKATARHRYLDAKVTLASGCVSKPDLSAYRFNGTLRDGHTFAVTPTSVSQAADGRWQLSFRVDLGAASADGSQTSGWLGNFIDRVTVTTHNSRGTVVDSAPDTADLVCWSADPECPGGSTKWN